MDIGSISKILGPTAVVATFSVSEAVAQGTVQQEGGEQEGGVQQVTEQIRDELERILAMDDSVKAFYENLSMNARSDLVQFYERLEIDE